MKLCGSTSFFDNPKDSFDLLFAGPFEAKMSFEKVDTFSKYIFEYEWKEDERDVSQQKLVAMWDTPGSRINRRASLNVVFNKIFYNYAALDLQIPVKQIAMNGVYQWTTEKKMLRAALAMERHTVAEMSYSLEQALEGRYESQLNVIFQDRKIIDWSARLIQTSSKMDGSSSLSATFLEEPVNIQASLTYNDDERWNLDGKLDCQWINTHLNGYFLQSDTSFNLKVKFDYAVGGATEEIEFQTAYKKNSVGELDKHIIFINVVVSYSFL